MSRPGQPKRRYVKRTRPGIFRGRNVGPAARQAAIQSSRNWDPLGVELKYLDTCSTAVSINSPTDCSGGEVPPTAGSTGCLSAPAQGDGPQNRDGSKMIMKRIYMTGVIRVGNEEAQATPETTPIVFLALVKDKQTNGAQLNSEDVFTNQSAQSIQAATVQRNMSFTNRFEVLKSMQLRIPATSASNDAAGTFGVHGIDVPFKLKKNFGPEGCRVQFNVTGATADVANVIDHSVHLIAFTSSTLMTPTISYNCRMRFVG